MKFPPLVQKKSIEWSSRYKKIIEFLSLFRKEIRTLNYDDWLDSFISNNIDPLLGILWELPANRWYRCWEASGLFTSLAWFKYEFLVLSPVKLNVKTSVMHAWRVAYSLESEIPWLMVEAWWTTCDRDTLGNTSTQRGEEVLCDSCVASRPSFNLLQIKESTTIHLIIIIFHTAVCTYSKLRSWVAPQRRPSYIFQLVVQPAAVRKDLRAAPGGIRRGGAEVIAEVLTAAV